MFRRLEPEAFVRVTARVSLFLSLLLMLPALLLVLMVSLLFDAALIEQALAMQGLSSPVSAEAMLRSLQIISWSLLGLSLLSAWASWGLLRYARWALVLFVALLILSAGLNAIGLLMHLMMNELMQQQVLPVTPGLNGLLMVLTVVLIFSCLWAAWRLLTPPVIRLFDAGSKGNPQ